jgi:hypothetical protein
MRGSTSFRRLVAPSKKKAGCPAFFLALVLRRAPAGLLAFAFATRVRLAGRGHGDGGEDGNSGGNFHDNLQHGSRPPKEAIDHRPLKRAGFSQTHTRFRVSPCGMPQV